MHWDLRSVSDKERLTIRVLINDQPLGIWEFVWFHFTKSLHGLRTVYVTLHPNPIFRIERIKRILSVLAAGRWQHPDLYKLNAKMSTRSRVLFLRGTAEISLPFNLNHVTSPWAPVFTSHPSLGEQPLPTPHNLPHLPLVRHPDAHMVYKLNKWCTEEMPRGEGTRVEWRVRFTQETRFYIHFKPNTTIFPQHKRVLLLGKDRERTRQRSGDIIAPPTHTYTPRL